jgi:hypothetical protein
MERSLLPLEQKFGQKINLTAIAAGLIGAVMVLFTTHTILGALLLLTAGAAFVFDPFRSFLLRCWSQIQQS